MGSVVLGLLGCRAALCSCWTHSAQLAKGPLECRGLRAGQASFIEILKSRHDTRRTSMAHHLGLWNLLGELPLYVPRSCPPNQRIVHLQRPGFRYTRKARQQLGMPVLKAMPFPVERESGLSRW